MNILLSNRLAVYHATALAYEVLRIESGDANTWDMSLPADRSESQKRIEFSNTAAAAAGWKVKRYRLSNEALSRRVVNISDFPRVNPLVDIANLLSLRTGLPVGIYRSQKIFFPIEIGFGFSGDAIESLSKGLLKVENCVIARDSAGIFGSVISDSKRTAIDESDHRALLILYLVPTNEIGGVARQVEEILSNFVEYRRIYADGQEQ